MKDLHFIIYGSKVTGLGWDKQENLTHWDAGKISSAKNWKDAASLITNLLKKESDKFKTLSLYHGEIHLTGNNKTVSYELTEDVLKTQFDTYKNVPYLCGFKKGYRKLDAEKKSNDNLLLGIAHCMGVSLTNGFKDKEISLNAFLRSVENKERDIRNFLYLDNNKIDKVQLTPEMKIRRKQVADIKRDIRETNKKIELGLLLPDGSPIVKTDTVAKLRKQRNRKKVKKADTIEVIDIIEELKETVKLTNGLEAALS